MISDPKRGLEAPSGPSSYPGRGAASPVVVFAILLAVVGVIAGAALLLGSDPTQQPATAASPLPSPTRPALTDEEAIARLAQLDALRIRALEERDRTLLDKTFTPDSPAARRVADSIKTLVKDRIHLEQRRYDVQKSEILSNTSSAIRIRQVVVVDVEFTDERGRRVTRGSGEERQVVVRTLKPVGSDWLFFDGRIVRAAPL